MKKMSTRMMKKVEEEHGIKNGSVFGTKKRKVAMVNVLAAELNHAEMIAAIKGTTAPVRDPGAPFGRIIPVVEPTPRPTVGADLAKAKGFLRGLKTVLTTPNDSAK